MKKFAIVEGGKVINIILWDGTTKFDLKAGQQAVDITSIKEVTIGSFYDGKDFTPPLPIEQEKSNEDIIFERLDAIQALLDKNGIK